jgi:hypothetical protein
MECLFRHTEVADITIKRPRANFSMSSIRYESHVVRYTMASSSKQRSEFANKVHVAPYVVRSDVTRTTCTSSSACVEVVGSSVCSSVLCYDQLPASFPCYLLYRFVSSPGEDDVSFNVSIGWLVV